MEKLTKNEKDLIITLLRQHLDEVRNAEKMPNQQLIDFAAEVEYDRFLENIIQKIEK